MPPSQAEVETDADAVAAGRIHFRRCVWRQWIAGAEVEHSPGAQHQW